MGPVIILHDVSDCYKIVLRRNELLLLENNVESTPGSKSEKNGNHILDARIHFCTTLLKSLENFLSNWTLKRGVFLVLWGLKGVATENFLGGGEV